ncbi:toll/interleukin-1 receptor domain-containing protein [Streptomyces sp. NPDC090022]|uniref:toll/interleukin-1 receptor domain-containing protein n=1 Tax=Streptomyces sp. NPDC090022 TaxID=3365920 RepID=UPI00381B3290
MERDAFISYSHRRDVLLAQALERALTRLAQPWTRRPALKVFRDTTSLAANSDLGSAIKAALGSSRYFVYLASPEAAASRWVREEIAFWRDNHSMDHFLIALAAGEIVWDEDRDDFDWDRTTALPEGLVGAFTAEPLWVDLRAHRDASHHSMDPGEFRDRIVTLAAAIHGVSKDTLDSEDLRRQRKAARIFRGLAAGLAVALIVALVAGLLAVRQRDEALARARTSASQALAARALEMADTDPRKAAQFALYAEQVRSTSEASQGLAAAVLANESVFRHVQKGAERFGQYVGASHEPETRVALSGDGSVLAYYSEFDADVPDAEFPGPPDGRHIHLFDVRTGTPLRTLISRSWAQTGMLQISSDGGLLVVETAFNQIDVWDVRSGRVIRSLVASDARQLSNARTGLDATALSRDGHWLAATFYVPQEEGMRLTVWDLTSGTPVHTEGGFAPESITLSFDTTNRLTALATDTGETRTFTPGTKAWSARRQLSAYPFGERSATLSADRLFVGGRGSQKAELWSISQGRRTAVAAVAGQPGTVVFPRDNTELIVGAEEERISLYDPALRKLQTLGSFSWPVHSMAVSDDGKWVAAASQDGAVSVFLTRDPGGATVPNGDRLKSGELTPDGRLGLRTGPEGTVVWVVADARTGPRQLGRIPVAVDREWDSVAASKDGSRIALIHEGELSLWDPRTGQRTSGPHRYDGGIGRGPLMFVGDGFHVVGGWERGLLLIDIRTGEVRQTILPSDGQVMLGTVSEDLSTLAVAGTVGEDLTVWRWAGNGRLERVRRAAQPEVTMTLAVSPEGSRVGVMDRNRRVSILQVDTGRLTTHSVAVPTSENDLVFSPDARHLVHAVRRVTGTRLQFWDTTTGDALGSWPIGTGKTGSPDVSRAEDEGPIRIVASSGGGVLAFEPGAALTHRSIDVANWRTALCALVPDPLPQNEYDRYLSDLDVGAPCRP